MTISQALQEFLIGHQIKGNSPHTVRYYNKNIAQFMAFTGDIQTDNISLSHLREYYLHLTSKPITSITIQTYIRAVRAFITWCYMEEYIPVNICDKFRLPKAKRKAIDILTDNEIQSLISCFNTKTDTGLRNLCICLLMLDSGLRMNEVVTLKMSSLHIQESYIIVTGKGDKERFVPIGLNTKKHLLKYMSQYRNYTHGETPLFVKVRTIPIENSTIKQLFRKLKIQSEIPRLRAHLLRHTFATRYLDNGGDIYSLQSILGHTTLEMVKKYIHTTPWKTAITFSHFSPIDNLTEKPRKP